ncbi:MAG TPA: aminotransferase class IV [Bacteroidales bacterium]|nr:aminotransferase class IV [Bacteroidales bacterium]
MEIIYLNGEYIPKDEARISPDDRGFLLADGIYEVVRWYGRDFFDMDGHISRLKRSLSEIAIKWDEYPSFPAIARKLLELNDLENKEATIYLQVTRGAAKRSHTYPYPPVSPTVYAFASELVTDEKIAVDGIRVMLKEDIRWSRCDIKSIALLGNTMSFQEAWSNGYGECAFHRDRLITECSHSNIFFIRDGVLLTHPESNFILSGITRNNTIRIAKSNGITVKEEAVNTGELEKVDESFVTNTRGEITPVTSIGDFVIGNGKPGPVTILLQEKFRNETAALKH